MIIAREDIWDVLRSTHSGHLSYHDNCLDGILAYLEEKHFDTLEKITIALLALYPVENKPLDGLFIDENAWEEFFETTLQLDGEELIYQVNYWVFHDDDEVNENLLQLHMASQ